MARHCYYIPVNQFDDGGYIPSLVEEGLAGHCPLTGMGSFAAPWRWGTTYEIATQVCAEANLEDFGLDAEEVSKIVASSMFPRVQ